MLLAAEERCGVLAAVKPVMSNGADALRTDICTRGRISRLLWNMMIRRRDQRLLYPEPHESSDKLFFLPRIACARGFYKNSGRAFRHGVARVLPVLTVTRIRSSGPGAWGGGAKPAEYKHLSWVFADCVALF